VAEKILRLPGTLWGFTVKHLHEELQQRHHRKKRPRRLV
jgi:hypothetical protein